MSDGIAVQAKPACDCTPWELMMEIVRQSPGHPEIFHAKFSEDRMMSRNDDGGLVLGGLVIMNLTVVRKSSNGEVVIR